MSSQTTEAVARGNPTDRFSPTLLKLCGWCGVAFLVLLGIGWIPLAHFVPPPAPSDSAPQIAHFFAQHRDGIRFGMILTMIGSTLLMPFFAAMVIHMRRIEGRHSVLAWIVLGLGAIFVLEFIYLAFFWQVATFRAGRSSALIQLLDDMAWIPFLGLTSTAIVQNIAFGWAILTDKRANPIFPRWLGYFNFWVALLFTPGTFNMFFKHGPLAWNGLLAFYLPLGVFFIWIIVVSVYLVKAAGHQVAERAELEAGTRAMPMSANGNAGPESSEAEIRRLRAEIDAVSTRMQNVELHLRASSSPN
jgi:hypothetical protein